MKLYSIRDCAKLLGVAPHRIAYAHETGKLPDVQSWVAGKRIYTTTELKRVARYFGVECDPDQQKRGEDHE